MHLNLKALQEVVCVDSVCALMVRSEAAGCLSLRALKHKTFLGNRFLEAPSIQTELSCFLSLGSHFSHRVSLQTTGDKHRRFLFLSRLQQKG